MKVINNNQNPDNNIYAELFSGYPEIISVEQMMEMLQIGKVLAYRMVEEKQVKSAKIGREYKIIKKSVIDLLLKGEQPTELVAELITQR